MADNKIYQAHRKELLSFIPKNIRTILDIGCSTGQFGKGLKEERELEIWGVEPNAEAAKKAKESLDNVVNGFFDEHTDVPDEHFDMVLFADSLEHFPSPEPPLILAKRKLSKNGVIVASIPNVRYFENIEHVLLEKDWHYEDHGIRDRTHLRFFTKKSIERLFSELGLEIISIEGVNAHHWSGKKMFLLKLFFGKWIDDMRYLQYVVTARTKN